MTDEEAKTFIFRALQHAGVPVVTDADQMELALGDNAEEARKAVCIQKQVVTYAEGDRQPDLHMVPISIQDAKGKEQIMYGVAFSGEKPKDFSFLPIRQYGGALTCSVRESFSALLDEFYLRRDRAEAMRRRSQALTRTVRTTRDRTAKKLALQREELRRSADRETLRRKADLITANLYRMKKGDCVLCAEDFYADGCPEVEIPLDPLKTPQQNAAALYKRYQKAKTAERHLTGLIAEAEQSLRYLDSVLDELQRAGSEQDLAEIRNELRAAGYLRREKASKREKSQPRAPLRFVSDSGYEILVGRSNTQNDELTHRIARRTDIWLHVQKIHGSHVIIRARDSTPDEQTLAQAASLAVYFSQARGGGKTPVDYTMARCVRKPSGALPGMVLYTEYQTILAESDEPLAHRLQKR